MGEAIKKEHLHYLICVPSLDELGYLENILNNAINLTFIVINHSVQMALEKLGFYDVYILQASNEFIEVSPVDRVIVLENDLTSTHFLIKIASTIVKAPIVVVTSNKDIPGQIYRLLGAKVVMHSNNKNIRFLLD